MHLSRIRGHLNFSYELSIYVYINRVHCACRLYKVGANTVCRRNVRESTFFGRKQWRRITNPANMSVHSRCLIIIIRIIIIILYGVGLHDKISLARILDKCQNDYKSYLGPLRLFTCMIIRYCRGDWG